MGVPECEEVVHGDERGLTEVVARLRRALRASIRTDYPWESLPMAQVEVLQSLAENSPTRTRDLAGRLRLAPSTVSALLTQMISAGLIARGTDPLDRRIAVVELSDAGRVQLAAWNEAHRRRISNALEALTPDDRACIGLALPALAQLAEHLAVTTAEQATGGTAAAPSPVQAP